MENSCTQKIPRPFSVDNDWDYCALPSGHDGECVAPCGKDIEGRYHRVTLLSVAEVSSCVLPYGHDGVCIDRQGHCAYKNGEISIYDDEIKTLTTHTAHLDYF